MAPVPRVRVAAIIVREGGVLLVRHEKDGRSYWMLPGGGVDYGESLHAALARELLEETGVNILPGPLVLVNDSIAPDGGRHVINLCFRAEIAGGTVRKGSDTRVAEALFVPLTDLPALDFRPPFADKVLEIIESGFSGQAVYLGNLWRF